MSLLLSQVGAPPVVIAIIPPIQRPRRRIGIRARRGSSTQTVPAQTVVVTVSFVPPIPKARRATPKSRRGQVTDAPITLVYVPPIAPTRRRVNLRARKGRVTQALIVVVVTPSIAPARRRIGLGVRRRQQPTVQQPVVVTVNYVPSIQAARRRRFGWRMRRGQTIGGAAAPTTVTIGVPGDVDVRFNGSTTTTRFTTTGNVAVTLDDA